MRSLHFRLVTFLLAMILSILISTTALYFGSSYANMSKELSRSRTDAIDLVSQQVDTILCNLDLFADFIKEDPAVQSTALGSTLLAAQKYNLNGTLSKHYLQYYPVFQDIPYPYGLVFLCKNGYTYSALRDAGIAASFWDAAWFQHRIQAHNDRYTILTDNPSLESDGKVVAAVRNLRSGTRGEYTASVIVYLDERALYDCYANILNESNGIYILDEDFCVISSGGAPALLSPPVTKSEAASLFDIQRYALHKRDGKSFLLTSGSLSQQDWTILEEISMRWLMRPFVKSLLLITGLVGALGILCISTAFLFARHITAPLQNFCFQLDQAVALDSLEPITGIHGYIEIETLGTSYNRLLTHIHNLMWDIREKEESIRKSEMSFLRAQIRPHFLYNTLFSIKCTIDLGRPSDAGKMITFLISMLRATVSSESPYTTVAEECNYLRTYIGLQRLRFDYDIELVFDIPKSLHSCVLLKFLLQPIVENSVFHGIEPLGRDGIIRIRCQEQDGALLIDVWDNGVGMSRFPEPKYTAENAGETSSQIGIQNIQSRIKLNYGEGYGISLVPCPEGTCIRFRLPLSR